MTDRMRRKAGAGARAAAGPRRIPARATAESSRTAVFKALLKQAGLPTPHAEYRFHDTRRWRFDWAFPQHSVAIEVDGGLYVRGAHVRGARIEKTHEKLNAAAAMGWRVLFTTPSKLCTPEVIEALKAAVSYRAAGEVPPS